LNSDLVICHLDESKSFEIELTVEKGRGYLPAEESKPKEQVFGVIPIDAIFTPIKNVNTVLKIPGLSKRLTLKS
jgi:DNA-directed RNA polymerase subunit alpha